MGLKLGDTAPNFQVETTKGKIDFHEFIGDSWCFFFSHPADFTPVCTTELGCTARLAEEFADRNVKSIGLSTDTVDQHVAWIDDINDTQNTQVDFPVIADKELKVANLYGMIHPGESKTATVRTLFIIDPDKKIRLTMTYPMAVGRNFDEILRAIDALQLGDEKQIATPANWQKGEEVIIPPSISNDAAKDIFPQGWNEVRPYLRLTKV